MAGAKGQPDTTYSYSVSLAVALSSRPLREIKRIWADGKLLRGENGDFKVATQFRFYSGSEDQEIDPLIGSIESISNTPAFRGLALAVFEDLELADFGNRIPFLTFEVQADEEPPAIANVLEDASDGFIRSDEQRRLQGYAAYGQSIKAAIEPLVSAFAVDLFDDGLKLRSPSRETFVVSNDELGSSPNNEPESRVRRDLIPARSLPASLRLRYYDPARDYQTGEARSRGGDQSGSEQQLEIPAALSADDAKSLAYQWRAREWAGRDRLRLSLPLRYLDLEPGAELDVSLNPGRWQVESCTIDGLAMRVDLRPMWSSSATLTADAGRIVANGDVVAGPVGIALLDIPALSPSATSCPMLLLAASSPTPGWKRSRVDVSSPGQTMAVRTAARKSALGSAATILASGDPSSIDTANSVEVVLIDAEQWLTSCDDDALAAGTNLAVIGQELIQFGAVTPLGDGRFHLARLLRGRMGTESAISGHSLDEIFCLIEPGSLQPIVLPALSAGVEVTAQVPGVDSTSVTVGTSVAPIASPTGGMTVDVEARSSIDQILTNMRQRGLVGF